MRKLTGLARRSGGLDQGLITGPETCGGPAADQGGPGSLVGLARSSGRRISHWLDTLLDILYPRTCMSCQGPVQGVGRYLCWQCRGQVEFQSAGSFCGRCGRTLPGALPPGGLCGLCGRSPPLFEAARSAAHFREPVRTLLLDFKYHGATWLCEDLADLLDACVRRHYGTEAIEAVCPVPLHPARWRERGYNQSELLAKRLGRSLGVPCLPDALQRVRQTPTQTHLRAAERRRNVRGAFAARTLLAPWLARRTLLLVDDVMTTGATLSEAARALRTAGAARVLAVTVARD